jgi:hypothetical protein
MKKILLYTYKEHVIKNSDKLFDLYLIENFRDEPIPLSPTEKNLIKRR